jgi:hypothetical protein
MDDNRSYGIPTITCGDWTSFKDRLAPGERVAALWRGNGNGGRLLRVARRHSPDNWRCRRAVSPILRCHNCRGVWQDQAKLSLGAGGLRVSGLAIPFLLGSCDMDAVQDAFARACLRRFRSSDLPCRAGSPLLNCHTHIHPATRILSSCIQTSCGVSGGSDATARCTTFCNAFDRGQVARRPRHGC